MYKHVTGKFQLIIKIPPKLRITGVPPQLLPVHIFVDSLPEALPFDLPPPPGVFVEVDGLGVDVFHVALQVACKEEKWCIVNPG